MKLFKEILIEVLQNEKVEVSFPNLTYDANSVVEMVCYDALKEIKAIIEDDSLEDSDCFLKIEEVIQVLERMGSDGGYRHDF